MTPDHQPITGQELEEMKRRCEKATEGPWQWWQEDDSEIILGNDDYAGEGHVLSCNRCQHCQKTMSDCSLPRKGDQDFLTHARGDLPRCLAEIERLRMALGKIEELNAVKALDRMHTTSVVGEGPLPEEKVSSLFRDLRWYLEEIQTTAQGTLFPPQQ